MLFFAPQSMQCLSKEFIVQWLSENNQTNILNLSNHHIEYIANLDGIDCSNLQSLNLSNNKLLNVSNLNVFGSLIELNLAFNKISHLNGLEKLCSLRILHINNNKIRTVSSLQPLHSIRSLQRLSIFDNPICDIPHFQLIIKQIVSNSVILNDKSTNCIKFIDTTPPISSPQSHQHMSLQLSDSKDTKLKKLEMENEALRRMLNTHEQTLKKCTHRNIKYDFKEWRNAFLDHLMEHESFYKKELEIKTSLKQKINELRASNERMLNENRYLKATQRENEENMIKCKHILSNRILSMNAQICQNNKEYEQRITKMNKNIDGYAKKINVIKQRLNAFQSKAKSDKQALFQQHHLTQQRAAEILQRLKNEKSIREFYGEQIVNLTKQNKECMQYSEEQNALIQEKEEKIKRQYVQIKNLESALGKTSNHLFKIKQKVKGLKNEQNDIQTAIKMSLHRHFNQMDSLQSTIHSKQNEIKCFKSLQISNAEKIIKRQFDALSNVYYERWRAMHAKMERISAKMDKMASSFENVSEITEKRQTVFIETINQLQNERDELIKHKYDDQKDESEDLMLFDNKTGRPSPRRFDPSYDDAEDKENKYGDDHISKLENLLNLTKSLLNETDEEKTVIKLLKTD